MIKNDKKIKKNTTKAVQTKTLKVLIYKCFIVF